MPVQFDGIIPFRATFLIHVDKCPIVVVNFFETEANGARILTV